MSKEVAMTDTANPTQPHKANDNQKSKTGVQTFLLPIIDPQETGTAELEIYARFMRHLRCVPTSVMDIKILAAIQFTSDMMDLSDALVAKTLVDMGLRAPRRAFPASYLDHVDRTLMRSGFDIGGPKGATIALKQHWDEIGEDCFAAFRQDYPHKLEPLHV
jgi:hypothetical protein